MDAQLLLGTTVRESLTTKQEDVSCEYSACITFFVKYQELPARGVNFSLSKEFKRSKEYKLPENLQKISFEIFQNRKKMGSKCCKNSKAVEDAPEEQNQGKLATKYYFKKYKLKSKM